MIDIPENMLFGKNMTDSECVEEFNKHIAKIHDNAIGKTGHRIMCVLKFEKRTLKRKVGKRNTRSQRVVRGWYEHTFDIESGGLFDLLRCDEDGKS